MPNFPWPGRRDASEDAALAALLAGVPADLPAELQPAADVLAALRARPTGDELVGESLALAEYRERVGASVPARKPRRRRPSLLTSLLSAKAAVAAAAVAITIGGVATAAYAGALPSTAQGIAHDWIGAPAAHKGADLTAANHPAVKPLCAAYWWAKRHGTAAQQAAAFSKLEKAAGGADKIAAYCRPAAHKRRHHFRHGCWVPVPSASWSPRPQPSWSPRPKPSASPSCTPVPFPLRSPRPHPKFHHVKHSHFPVGKPGRPVGKPTPPSGHPTPTPTPSA